MDYKQGDNTASGHRTSDLLCSTPKYCYCCLHTRKMHAGIHTITSVHTYNTCKLASGFGPSCASSRSCPRSCTALVTNVGIPGRTEEQKNIIMRESYCEGRHRQTIAGRFSSKQHGAGKGADAAACALQLFGAGRLSRSGPIGIDVGISPTPARASPKRTTTPATRT